MKLLVEEVDKSEILTEEKDGKKSYFIKGIFMQAGVKNGNKRVYPTQVMEAAANKYIKEAVKNHRAYGELDHPHGNPSTSLQRVSHIIESLDRDGNNWIGKARVIEAGMGTIAIGLIEAGANLGVSSRALGSVKMNRDHIYEVQPDFRIISAADLVANPSAPDAFVEGLMESQDWVYENGIFKEVDIESSKAIVNEAVRTKNKAKINESFLIVWHKLMDRV